MTEPKKDKRKRGRPVVNEVKPIPATAENVAKAIFHAADKKILKKPQGG